ncbi:MAG: YezD family protein [Eubacterium sp.]|nr:YezD family protein [Eubacterium sp.]
MSDNNKEKYLELISKYVKELKYGNIVLVIQDGKVIQIDKTEKIRL